MATLIGVICLFVVLVLAAVGLTATLLARHSSANSRLAAKRKKKIAQITRDFPDEVRAWGGPEALRNPQTVRAMIAKLEAGK